MPPTAPTGRRVALVTLGCGRNEVDSEELAGRLAADGWLLVPEAADADVAVVNTCGFVEAAKKDSVDTLLAAADLKGGGRTQAVVAVGCLAERYGEQLAAALPEADAVLGFDDYADISARLGSILDGTAHVPHVPRDRRRLLPLAPADRAAPVPARPDLPAGVAPASGPQPLRMRLGDGPTAALKLASGCDRRCTFCAIPTFRGSFVSRRPHEVLAEAAWLAGQGVREIVLVSENSTSYGKDLGDLRLLESLLPDLAAIDGVDRVRVSYLQPAEMRPGLIEAMATTPGVLPYFDLSFQHASGPVLRRMRRFGDTDRFLDLVAAVRDGGTRRGHPVQRHRRLPRRDRGRPRRARALPGRGPARRRGRVRLLRRGRHRGGHPDRQAAPRTSCTIGSSASPGWPRSWSRNAPRNESARPSTCSSRRSTRAPAPPRAGLRTRAPRSTAAPRCSAVADLTVGQIVPRDRGGERGR